MIIWLWAMYLNMKYWTFFSDFGRKRHLIKEFFLENTISGQFPLYHEHQNNIPLLRSPTFFWFIGVKAIIYVTHQAWYAVVKYLNIWLKFGIFGWKYLKICLYSIWKSLNSKGMIQIQWHLKKRVVIGSWKHFRWFGAFPVLT